MDKKIFTLGILFIIGGLYCIFILLTSEFATHLVSGAILFPLVGIALIKRALSR